MQGCEPGHAAVFYGDSEMIMKIWFVHQMQETMLKFIPVAFVYNSLFVFPVFRERPQDILEVSAYGEMTPFGIIDKH